MAFTSFVKRCNKGAFTQCRRGFGWLTKNARVEEFTGIRESTYRNYSLTPMQLLQHTIFLFIPMGLIFFSVQSDLKHDYTRMGRPDINFGLFGNLMEETTTENEEEEE
mmetsp:Transcript_1602/g.2551  ORF Transcript_1602/g.2551 Transcript_1602/m.2551 type:complete len:108 (+) Transcript_1602:65-388(+)